MDEAFSVQTCLLSEVELYDWEMLEVASAARKSLDCIFSSQAFRRGMLHTAEVFVGLIRAGMKCRHIISPLRGNGALAVDGF